MSDSDRGGSQDFFGEYMQIYKSSNRQQQQLLQLAQPISLAKRQIKIYKNRPHATQHTTHYFTQHVLHIKHSITPPTYTVRTRLSTSPKSPCDVRWQHHSLSSVLLI